jgi:hypothetical protein
MRTIGKKIQTVIPGSISGGTKQSADGNDYIQFNSSSSLNIQEDLIYSIESTGVKTYKKQIPLEYMLVGGGGPGGGSSSTTGTGGGGAGGVVNGFANYSTGSKPIIVGSGGSGNFTTSSVGNNTQFDNNIATGGGSGCGLTGSASIGASGGGGGPGTAAGASSLLGNSQGYNGGNYTTNGGGGGGGCSQIGTNGATNVGGKGGDGILYNKQYFAGGGGGGSSATAGLGGLGGGSQGQTTNGNPSIIAGYMNSGGGGGGTGNTTYVGGSGGSGTAIFKYPKSQIIDPYTKLLIHGYGSIYDSSYFKDKNITNSGVVVSSTQSKFGGSSMYFNNSTSTYLRVPWNNDFEFGSSDFTIDLWVYFNGNIGTARQALFACSEDFRRFGILTNNASPYNKLALFISSNGTSWDISGDANIGTTALVNNKWYHITFVREGSYFNVYVDGILDIRVFSTASISTSNTYLPNNLQIGLWGNSSFALNGYINEFRMTKGIARWTASFTPPTQAYPSAKGQDPFTKLLLHGTSTNFTDESGTNKVLVNTGAVSANSNITKNNQYSLAFNGTSNYLNVSGTNADLAFGTGDFTIEFWCYPTDVSGHKNVIDVRDSTDTNKWNISITPNIVLQITNTTVLTGNTISVNNWYHIAITRNTGTFKLFYNGQLQSTYTASHDLICGSNGLCIGAYGGGLGSYNYSGYLTDIRVSNIARYTANFTPPTDSLTSDSNTKLLIKPSAPIGFVDDSYLADKTVTPNSVAFNTSTYKFGGSSMYFNGATNLSVPISSDFDFGNSDFTIDFWINPGTTTSGPSIFAYNTYYNMQIAISSTYKIGFALSSTGGSWNITDSNGNIAISSSSWSHVALVRSGSNFYLFINGVLDVTATSTLSITTNSATQIKIGCNYQSNYFTGYLDEFRISKGIARWTTSFTPPQRETIDNPWLSSDSYTKLLLHANEKDGSIKDYSYYGDKQIVRNGNCAISTNNSKFGGSSIYFPGAATDYCYVAGSSSDFVFGTSDFTIEFWVYFTTLGSDQLLFDMRNGSQGLYPVLYLTGNTIRYHVNGDVITSSAITSNTWYYVALSRQGTNTKLFLNGVQTGSTYPDTNSYLCGVDRPIFGNDGVSVVGYLLYGYMDEIRVSKGVARYTSNFTPYNRPHMPQIERNVDPYTKLLIHGDLVNGFKDFSNAGDKIVANNGPVTISTTQSKYFGSSMYFPNSLSYSLQTPWSPDFTLNNNFTIDCWYYGAGTAGTTVSTDQTIFSFDISYYFNMSIFGGGLGGKFGFGASSNGSSWDIASQVVGTTGLVNGSWYHLALVRSGNTFYVFVNGVLEATHSPGITTIRSDQYTINIGKYPGFNPTNGYINELRFSKGIARWTSNFTPPLPYIQ